MSSTPKRSIKERERETEKREDSERKMERKRREGDIVPTYLFVLSRFHPVLAR